MEGCRTGHTRLMHCGAHTVNFMCERFHVGLIAVLTEDRYLDTYCQGMLKLKKG